MQKLKNMSIKLAAALAISTALTGVVYAPTYAAQLNCAYLPQSICNQANNQGSGTNVKNTAVFLLLSWVLKFVIAMVGIAAVGGTVWAGIIYTSAGGDAAKVKQAKTMITNIVIGLIAFGLMFLVLNWLIPGGVLQ